jgi:hypothetical protein
VRAHADALGAVQRALKEKAAVQPRGAEQAASGTVSGEQQTALSLLSDPKRWRT